MTARKPPLVGLYAMPPVSGLASPSAFYWILANPAPLAGMRFPRTTTPWSALHAVGFRWVVCLSDDEQLYDPAPLQFAFAQELEDLSHGGVPTECTKEERRVRDAVQIVKRKLRLREGVIVHCQEGTGRTGTVLGCVLRALGYNAEVIIGHLDELHRLRGKGGWPESAWQADLVRRSQQDAR